MVDKIKVDISDRKGQVNTFTNFGTLIDFLKQEISFWTEVDSELVELKKINNFQEAGTHKKILSWVNALEKPIKENSEIGFSDQKIQNIIIDINKGQWLSSTRGYTRAYIDCYKKYGKEPANVFLGIVSNSNNMRAVALNTQNTFGMLAILSAYEYLSKDGSFASRQNSELSALKQLYKDYFKSKQELDEDIINKNKAYQDGIDEKNNQFEQLCNNASLKSDEITEKHDKSFEDLYTESKNKINELEDTYKNKLALEAPVEYWKTAATECGEAGKTWSWILGGIVGGGVALFSVFFVVWLCTQSVPLKLTSLQGIVIFGVILTLFAVAVRISSKMMLSSYHLMRDAKEREKLVYLYLALNKDGKMESNHSEIVLQALFSRSDSGLLSKDTGVVMPTVHDVLKVSS
jgi:hypothetical protein